MEDEAEQLQRVEALIELGRPDEARARLLTILAARPDSAEALALLSACLLELGDPSGALAAADQAVAAEPEGEWGHRMRAWALLVLERPDEATAAASEAVRLAPEGWAGHLALAVARTGAAGSLRAGRASLDRAAALAPDEAGVPFIEGQLRRAFGWPRSARRAYRRALRIDPLHAGALEGLAAIEWRAGRLGESLRYVRSAAAAAPGHVAVAEYLDRAAMGAAGWALLASWFAMLALLFTATPAAWVVAVVVVAGYLLWLWWQARALPRSTAGLVWSRIGHDARTLVRLLAAGACLLVGIGVGVAASRCGFAHWDPVPELMAIAVAFAASVAAVAIVDFIDMRPRQVTAMDLVVVVFLDPAWRRLAFLSFCVVLVPAMVLFVPAVDPEPSRQLRATLGTALLVPAALLTAWIVWRHLHLSAEALARWRRLPAWTVALLAPWVVLAAFAIGASYLPDGSPLLVDFLAVLAFVFIPLGVLVLLAVLATLAVGAVLRRTR